VSFSIGIVGLPNVGKSTLFKALTQQSVDIQNYPFCTIEPNVGIVTVPDERLEKLASFYHPKKIVPAIVEFLDIAGLVKGASRGEGLGNKFLENIRQTKVICHVVRCFDNSDIIHVSGKINPVEDIETIEIELALSDLEIVSKRKDNLSKQLKAADKELLKKITPLLALLEKLEEALKKGVAARSLGFTDEEIKMVNDLSLITLKKQIYCCNVDDKFLEHNEYVEKTKEIAQKNGSEVVVISAQLESEIADLSSETEKKEFLKNLGLAESGLNKLIKLGYQMLDFKTFLTGGEDEVRAWTFIKGMKAPETAGIIHSDFEKGFIKAEVFNWKELFDAGSELAAREKGLMKIVGRDYVVQDGDVMHFLFKA
jgi:GTP-binding protein YchF